MIYTFDKSTSQPSIDYLCTFSKVDIFSIDSLIDMP